MKASVVFGLLVLATPPFAAGCSGAPTAVDAGNTDAGGSDAGPQGVGPTIGWTERPGGLGGRIVTSIDDAGINYLTLDRDAIVWGSGWGLLQTDRFTGVSRVLHRRENYVDTPLMPVGDGTSVYWTGFDDTLKRLDRASGDTQVIALTHGDTAALELADNRIWLGDGAGVTVYPKSGSDGGIAIDVGGAVTWLAIDGDEGYASVLPGGFFLDIVHFDLSGIATVVAPSQEMAAVLAVDADAVYWGTRARDGGAGALVRAPRDGGPAEQLLRFDLPVGPVAVVGGVLYLATFPNYDGPSPDQSIYKYEVATGTLVELATGLRFVLQIVPGPDALYWSESNRRLARLAPLP